MVLSAASVTAGGQAESRIGEAERLVDESRYDEAILLLKQVIEDDPDRLDEAERLLSKFVRSGPNSTDATRSSFACSTRNGTWIGQWS